MQMPLNNMNEREWQPLVHSYLSDPSCVFTVMSGKRLQMLSPGRLNPHEGPDFLDVALLLDGLVIVGDAEFHLKSSDWNLHKHSDDKRYDRVILHLVFEDNSKVNFHFETLLLEKNQIFNYDKINGEDKYKASPDSVEDLQHYALVRLLRKTADAQKLLKKSNIANALIELTHEFTCRYSAKRTRPLKNNLNLNQIAESMPNSLSGNFLNRLSDDSEVSIPDIMQMMLKHKIAGEGAHLRREIILNAVLPLALCLAEEESRINLFLWYWSTPALNKYGILSRRFTNLPQNFLWQQQGMLEYMKEHGRKSNIVADTLKEYGFNEILSFYRLAGPPFKRNDEFFDD